MSFKNTLLQKVLLLFFTIMLPFVIVCLFLLQQRSSKSQEQILSRISTNQDSYSKQVDDSISQLAYHNSTLLAQSNVLFLANLADNISFTEQRHTINLLREQMTNVCETNPYLAEIHIYFKHMGRGIHSSGYSLGSLYPFSTETYAFLLDLATQQKAIQCYENPFTKQNTSSIFLLPLTKSPHFIVELTLSITNITAALKNNKLDSKERYLLEIDHSNLITDLNEETTEELLQTMEYLEINTFQPITYQDQDYYLFYNELPSLQSRYVRLIPKEVLFPNVHYSIVIYLIFILIVTVPCIVFFFGIYRLVHQPMLKLTQAFYQLENGNFKIIIQEKKSSDFSYLYKAFNNMVLKLQNLIEIDYHQKILLQKAELKQLQAQINPHFLYNSFFMLQRMIKMNVSEDAEKMANALAIYFRYITKNSATNVTLSEEYEHAKKYAYIQGLRYQRRIEVSFEDLPEGCSHLPIPKLILQPLIENAFFYGLDDKPKDGILRILFEKTQNELSIHIEDNGDKLTEENFELLRHSVSQVQSTNISQEMSGILNISRRLAIFTQRDSSVRISRSPLGGLKVTICLSLVH